MKIKREQFEARQRKKPEFDLAAAIVRVDGDDIEVDFNNPVWVKAFTRQMPPEIKRGESVPVAPCGTCGGKNAVAEAAMARTPAELERAILEA